MSPPPRPNWFVGLPVDWQDPLPPELAEPPRGMRGFGAADHHLTARFLGACAEEQAHAAFVAVARHRFPGFHISLGEVVPMGPPARWSALSALLADGRSEVESWMRQVRDPQERRPVCAHITLARPQRRAEEAQRAAGLAWAQALPVCGLRACLPRLALYTWAEDRSRGLFQIVRTQP